jgi:hypothetical protein
MRRKLLLLTMLFFVFTLSSCQKEDTVETIAREGRQVAETSDENFKIILYSEKDSYSDTEEVDIWATIEYIGSEDNIDIYSGEPYAGYIVESEGVTFISNLAYKLLKTTTLEKGTIYEFPLKKVGGFSNDAEDADFWRDFYSEEKMLFPIGEYQLTFLTDFYTNDSVDFQLSLEYQIEVR